MLSERKEKFKKIENKVGEILGKFLTPNQYTLISLGFALICFYFLISQDLIKALIFFSLAAVLDFIDGAVARFLKLETKRGAYLDTICDRYVEAIIWLGFLFLPLPKIILPSFFWIFLAFFGSLMTTYAKAAAKEKELVKIELKKGLIGRGERMILMFLALCLGVFNLAWLLYLIIVLAVLSNLTALERISLVLKD